MSNIATPVASGGRSGCPAPRDGVEAIRAYWDARIHDAGISRHPVGTRQFFNDLAAYRFEKLAYLPRLLDSGEFKGKQLLEVGCGIGIDLVRFAKHGARVTGIDLSETAIMLARKNFAFHGVGGDLRVMDGENLKFPDETFDAVYAHGVLQYTRDARRMVVEIRRVLKPAGQAILMVYNRYSWLNLLARAFGVKLEHEDAPVLRKYSVGEFKEMLSGFSRVEIHPERFPVRTRLHQGLKAELYNRFFVGAFNLLPRRLTRRLGWHLIARAVKGEKLSLHLEVHERGPDGRGRSGKR